MSMLNNLYVACLGGLICLILMTFVQLSQPLEKENNLEISRKKGGKVVHGWFICRDPSTVYLRTILYQHLPTCQYANPKGCWIDTLKEGFLLRHRKEYISTESRHISISHEFDFFLGSFVGIPALNHHHLVWPKPRFGPLLLAPIYHFMMYLWVQQIPWGFLPNTEEIFVFVLFWGHLTHL